MTPEEERKQRNRKRALRRYHEKRDEINANRRANRPSRAKDPNNPRRKLQQPQRQQPQPQPEPPQLPPEVPPCPHCGSPSWEWFVIIYLPHQCGTPYARRVCADCKGWLTGWLLLEALFQALFGTDPGMSLTAPRWRNEWAEQELRDGLIRGYITARGRHRLPFPPI